MPKVILLKTTKIKGQGFKKAGETIDVSPEQKKDLLTRGIISDGKSPIVVDNKELDSLKEKLSKSESENEALKVENEALKVEILSLKEPEDNKESASKETDLLGKK